MKRVPDHRHMAQLKSSLFHHFFTELVKQETKLSVKTKTKVSNKNVDINAFLE